MGIVYSHSLLSLLDGLPLFDGLPFAAHRLRKHLRHPSSNLQDLQETQAAVKEYFRHRSHQLPAHTAARARQGIVFCAGGRRLLANAFVSIKASPAVI